MRVVFLFIVVIKCHGIVKGRTCSSCFPVAVIKKKKKRKEKKKQDQKQLKEKSIILALLWF